jgi:AcrR family transcriptional regulator
MSISRFFCRTGVLMAGYGAAGMVDTPWGRAEDLQARRLRPGPGGRPEDVTANQRERLFAAMVACNATRGYPATTVADLIKLAGVSRATFYDHFEDKPACFRAAVEALLGAGLRRIEKYLQGPGNPRERGERALRSFLDLLASQPAAARMSLVDAYSAGPAGSEPIDDAFERACELMHNALRMLPGFDRTPPELSRAVVGGIHHVIYVHLDRGEPEALAVRAPELWKWASGFSPPDGLPAEPPRKRAAPLPSPPSPRDVHERILRGFAKAVAARGFPTLTIPPLTAETGISNATFYQHFENKNDALLAALDLSGAQLKAAALPAASREPHWPQAVRRAVEALCAFLASEPDYARLRAVEVFSAGPEALAHRDRAWEEIIDELVPGGTIVERTEAALLAIDASSGGVYSLIYEKVRRGELQGLLGLPPLLTYLMLAPLIGPEEAIAVAASSGSHRRFAVPLDPSP